MSGHTPWREIRHKKSEKPKPPAEDVVAKQDPEYSAANFERDLEKVTRRLDDPSARDPGSPKTGGRRPSGGST